MTFFPSSLYLVLYLVSLVGKSDCRYAVLIWQAILANLLAGVVD